MVKLSKLLAPLFVFSISTSFAAEIAGVNFSDTLKFNNKDLVLNGVGLREATIFKIKAYAGALYLEKKSSEADSIAKAQDNKTIVMHFLRDVDKGKIKDTYMEGFGKNCETNCEALKPVMEQMVGSLSDMKKTDVLKFEFSSKKVTAYQNGVQKFQTEASDFAEAILKLYLGKNPPNESLKKGLLGQ